MSGMLYNNIGTCALGIAFTMRHLDRLSVSRAALIAPIIAHRSLLHYMARKTTHLQSIEQFIVRNPEYFTNFNNRFYDGLAVTVNSIQFLTEAKLIHFENGNLFPLKNLDYDKAMGERARKIFDASLNIANITNNNLTSLYSNLRIKL